jgi:hypothetical protein
VSQLPTAYNVRTARTIWLSGAVAAWKNSVSQHCIKSPGISPIRAPIKTGRIRWVGNCEGSFHAGREYGCKSRRTSQSRGSRPIGGPRLCGLALAGRHGNRGRRRRCLTQWEQEIANAAPPGLLPAAGSAFLIGMCIKSRIRHRHRWDGRGGEVDDRIDRIEHTAVESNLAKICYRVLDSGVRAAGWSRRLTTAPARCYGGVTDKRRPHEACSLLQESLG